MIDRLVSSCKTFKLALVVAAPVAFLAAAAGSVAAAESRQAAAA